MNGARAVVLDASALLAFLQGEPGGRYVEARLEQASVSSVNWSEVLQRSLSQGVSVHGLREDLQALGLDILPYTVEDAEASAGFWPITQPFGLSLGDRACLALATRLGLPAVTADQAWTRLEVGVDVLLIR